LTERQRALLFSILLGCVALGAANAVAEDTPDVASFASPTTAPLARLAAAVTGVGLLGWGLTLWSRRRTRSMPDGERIAVVARRSLGPRHHVAILDAAGRRLLVGFAGDQITTLADLTDEQVFQEELGRSLATEPEQTEPSSPELVESIGRFEGLDG
jgi:flagellar biogenesis protein FliO